MPENARKRQSQNKEATATAENKPLTEPLRLNKAIAAAGICSRRQADALIEQGLVMVNGQPVIEAGLRIRPGLDTVAVRGKPIAIPAETERAHTYLMLHKPVQVVSTARDPQGRATVLDFLPKDLRTKRLYPVGRLDYFSEGLLLLTDDGELTNRLTHPRHHLPKVYEISLRETPSPEHLEIMRRGMTLAEGEKLAPVEASLLPNDPGTLRLILRQGINRQIRRMCRDLSLTILRLRRVALGPLELGDLPKGAVRPLSALELRRLKQAAGLP